MMTQNPYAQAGFGGPSDFDQAMGPSRTSVLAVLSLVFALVCFVPGSGLVAVLFGVAGLFMINSSRGRLRGTGLAVTGTALGLIFSALWVFVLIGAAQMNEKVGKEFIAPISSVMAGIEAADRDKARALLTPGANAAVTDQKLDEFREAYRTVAGEFQGMPESLGQMIAAYFKVGQAMQSAQGMQNVIPMPATFAKGMTVVLVELDPTASPQGSGGSSLGAVVKNLGVIPPSGGQVVWLVDPNTPTPTAPPAPRTTPPPSDPPPSDPPPSDPPPADAPPG